MEKEPSLWHMPPHTLPKTTRRKTSMRFCKTLLAQDRRMTLLSLSDSNTALSQDARTNWPDVVGTTFVDKTTNDNGERLLSFCRSTEMCIADSWVSPKRIHHWTWYSTDGFTKKSHRSYHHLASIAAMRHTVPCIPRRPTPEHRSPSAMRTHTPETEGTSGLTPPPPTGHLTPGGPSTKL